MHTQRLSDILTKYWELIKKDNGMPNYSAVNKASLAGSWEQCLTVKTQPTAAGTPPRFQCVEAGAKIDALFGRKLVGEVFTPKQKHLSAARIMARLEEVWHAPAPLYDEGQFVSETHKTVKFRSCLLPFGHAGEVTHILVGLSWREF
jgi:hypothetical protein